MGNIVLRAGLEPPSLAFESSVLTITPLSLPDVSTLLTPTCLCGYFLGRLMQSTTRISHEIVSLLMLTSTYTDAYTVYVQQPHSVQG